MYNQKVIDIFKNPTNAGNLKGANAVGKVGNPACGDIMKIYLKILDNGMIEDAKFKTFGCAAAIASTNMACDLIKGKSVEYALSVKNSQVLAELGGLPAQKIHCSVLAEEAIHAAIEDWERRKYNKLSIEVEENEEADKATILPVVKKSVGRGRPKKITSQTTISATNVSGFVSATKVGRGRPRKKTIKQPEVIANLNDKIEVFADNKTILNDNNEKIVQAEKNMDEILISNTSVKTVKMSYKRTIK